VKTASEMTFTVSGGALNSTQSNPMLHVHAEALDSLRVHLNVYLVIIIIIIIIIIVLVVLCVYMYTEERVNLSCDNHLMKVCVHRNNANLSDVDSSVDADCSDAAVAGIVKQTTNDGFCYVIDMSLCRSSITNRRNLTDAVCILHSWGVDQ